MDEKGDMMFLREKTADELKEMLDSEIEKCAGEADLELIDELISALLYVKGLEYKEVDAAEKLAEMKRKNINSEKFSSEKKNIAARRSRLKKVSVAVAVVCIMLACGNAYTVSAYSKNLFSYAVKFTKGGAVVDLKKLNSDPEILLPLSDDDPYGMVGKCKELGINSALPYYIPNGFVLTDINTQCDENSKYIFFRFENKEKFITITINNYVGDDGNVKVGIASKEHNVKEFYINKEKALLSQEDNQSNLVFYSNGFIVNIFTQDVDYKECEGIFKSIGSKY